MPKHTEQLRLRGMNESQIQEAMKVADIVVGFSEYLYKTDYSLDKWMEELRAMMKHIKGQKPHSSKASSGGECRPDPLHRRSKCISDCARATGNTDGRG